MVKIRLERCGSHKRPVFRIVVADSRAKQKGKTLATLGTYDPVSKTKTLTLDADEALAWLERGAQPTESASRLLTRVGVLELYEKQRPANAPRSKAKAIVDRLERRKQSDDRFASAVPVDLSPWASTLNVGTWEIIGSLVAEHTLVTSYIEKNDILEALTDHVTSLYSVDVANEGFSCTKMKDGFYELIVTRQLLNVDLPGVPAGEAILIPMAEGFRPTNHTATRLNLDEDYRTILKPLRRRARNAPGPAVAYLSFHDIVTGAVLHELELRIAI